MFTTKKDKLGETKGGRVEKPKSLGIVTPRKHGRGLDSEADRDGRPGKRPVNIFEALQQERVAAKQKEQSEHDACDTKAREVGRAATAETDDMAIDGAAAGASSSSAGSPKANSDAHSGANASEWAPCAVGQEQRESTGSKDIASDQPDEEERVIDWASRQEAEWRRVESRSRRGYRSKPATAQSDIPTLEAGEKFWARALVREAPGETHEEKLRAIKDTARSTGGCLSIRQNPSALGTEVLMAFRSESALEEAKANLSGPNSQRVIKEYTSEERDKAERCSVKLRGIPLNTTKEQVVRECNRYGAVHSGQVTIRGNWLDAVIQFEEEEVARYLAEQWSFFLGCDRINVLPAKNWQQVAADRRQHELKLVGIPRWANAQWLARYIEDVKGRTCLVPRSTQHYFPRNFAFVAFATAEDRDNAICQVRRTADGHVLRFVHVDAQPCFECGMEGHYARFCESRIQREKYNNARKNAMHIRKELRPGQKALATGKTYAAIARAAQPQQKPAVPARARQTKAESMDVERRQGDKGAKQVRFQEPSPIVEGNKLAAALTRLDQRLSRVEGMLQTVINIISSWDQNKTGDWNDERYWQEELTQNDLSSGHSNAMEREQVDYSVPLTANLTSARSGVDPSPGTHTDGVVGGFKPHTHDAHGANTSMDLVTDRLKDAEARMAQVEQFMHVISGKTPNFATGSAPQNGLPGPQ
jgi:hypothetical protein